MPADLFSTPRYSQGYRTPVVIATEVMLEGWLRSTWGSLISNVKELGGNRQGNTSFSGAGSSFPKPINLYRTFTDTDKAVMSMTKRLRQAGWGTYGDTAVSGTEGTLSRSLTDVILNKTTVSLMTHVGEMNDLKAKRTAMANEAETALTQWVAEQMDWEVTKAIYEGYSSNLTASSAVEGLGITKRYNPNFYFAGAGFATWSATAATYLNTLVEACTILYNDGAVAANTGMSAALLDRLLNDMKLYKNINPIGSEGGEPMWRLYIHPAQEFQLLQDEAFRQIVNSAFSTREMSHPLLSGHRYRYKDFAIFVSTVAAPELHYEDSAVHGGTDDLVFGPATYTADSPSAANIHDVKATAITVDSSKRHLKCATIVGNEMMNYAYANAPKFVYKDNEYDSIEAIQWKNIWGAVRADWTDAPGTYATITTADNYSTVCVATHSPDMDI